MLYVGKYQKTEFEPHIIASPIIFFAKIHIHLSRENKNTFFLTFETNKKICCHRCFLMYGSSLCF